MVELSASNMIFFILAILMAASVAGTMVISVRNISSAMVSRTDTLSEKMRSDVTIINDPEDATPSSSLILYIKNTGEKSLPSGSENINIFLDGRYLTGLDTNVYGGGNWDPGKVLIVNTTKIISTGDHRVKVSVAGGISDEFQFRE